MSSSFTVLTFNIRNNLAVDDGRNWWGFRRRAVVEVLNKEKTDLIALQEVRISQLRYLRGAMPDHQVISGGRRNGRSRGEHCPVLVNPERFEVLDWDVRWFSPTPLKPGSRDPNSRHPRIATFVSLRDLWNGTRLVFVNLHLDHHSPDARHRAVEALALRISRLEHPPIVVGDFNCRIDDSVLTPLWRAGLRDGLSALPPSGRGAASTHQFTGSTDGTRIDHILVPRRAGIETAAIDFDRPRGRLASDHWAVRATLRLESDASEMSDRPEAENGLSLD